MFGVEYTKQGLFYMETFSQTRLQQSRLLLFIKCFIKYFDINWHVPPLFFFIHLLIYFLKMIYVFNGEGGGFVTVHYAVHPY